MSLYTDRGAHYFHTPKAGGEVDRGHPTKGRAGARAARGRAYRSFFSPGPGPLGAGVRNASGSSGQGARACRHNRHRGRQRLHPRGLSARPQRPLRRRSGRPRLGLHAHSGRRSR
jgi:hypothetical protein